MNNSSRVRIFERLNSAGKQAAAGNLETIHLPVQKRSQNEKIEKLKDLMEAVHAQVHVVQTEKWIDHLKTILKKREVKTLLYAPETATGDALKKAWPGQAEGLPVLVPYASDIEKFKEDLFQIDAAITSTAGGIAETGALILWPDQKEPRLMSLVPPIHIAVLEAEKIFNTFGEAMQTENWALKMPTNILLISGPSKTADIELTLAFGVHGPKELLVLILT